MPVNCLVTMRRPYQSRNHVHTVEWRSVGSDLKVLDCFYPSGLSLSTGGKSSVVPLVYALQQMGKGRNILVKFGIKVSRQSRQKEC